MAQLTLGTTIGGKVAYYDGNLPATATRWPTLAEVGAAATNHNHAGVYAPVVHTHTIANVTGLQAALDELAGIKPTTDLKKTLNFKTESTSAWNPMPDYELVGGWAANTTKDSVLAIASANHKLSLAINGAFVTTSTGVVLRGGTSDWESLLGINDAASAGGVYLGKKDYWIRTGNATEQPKVSRGPGSEFELYHKGNKPTPSEISAMNTKVMMMRSGVSVGDVNLIASNYASGTCTHPDVEFATSSNGIAEYNNTAGGGVVVTRKALATAPNSTKQILEVSYDHTLGASPGRGGFVQGVSAAANKVFVTVFTARLSADRSFSMASNSMGEGHVNYWATDNKGTGKWETYIRVTICGEEGPFSSGGHIFVEGPDTSFTFEVAACATYDMSHRAIPLTLANTNSAYSSNYANMLNKIPYIKGDGVTEIGSHLDFHASGSTQDYDARLHVAGSNLVLSKTNLIVNSYISGYKLIGTSMDNSGVAANQAVMDGHGLIGNRGAVYLTNQQDSGCIVLGIGLHGAASTAKFYKNYSEFHKPIAVMGNNYADFGPNTSWAKKLRIGGNGRTDATVSTVCTTDGNLHLDPIDGKHIYLNYYNTGGNANKVYFAKGNTGYSLNGDGSITSLKVLGAQGLSVNNTSSSTKYGVSLYGTNPVNPDYGFMFSGTATSGNGGYAWVNGDWAIYSQCAGATSRGFIWKVGGTHVASVSGSGHMMLRGVLGLSNVGTADYLGMQANVGLTITTAGRVTYIGSRNGGYTHYAAVGNHHYFYGNVKIQSSLSRDGGSSGSWGSIDVSGQKGGYAGIRFTDFSSHLMWNSAIQGAHNGSAWLWYWSGGVLTAGTVPWARISGKPVFVVQDGTSTTTTFSNWVRTSGGTGWYSSSYGGGIHMTDTTWIRTYNGKKFYVAATANDAIHSSGGVVVSGNVTAYSDERLKENIEDITDAIWKVQQIRGVTYNRKDRDDNMRQAGVIAQEVEKVLPEVVITKDDEMQTKSVAYGNITALLIQAIKEQQVQIDELKSIVFKLGGHDENK